MYTGTLNNSFENPFRKLILLGGLILLAAIIIQLGFHALKHGENVHDCLSGSSLQTWRKEVKNSFTGKTDEYLYCVYESKGKFYIFEYVKEDILSKACAENNICREITTIIKDKMKYIEQVENYLRNGGATRIK